MRDTGEQLEHQLAELAFQRFIDAIVLVEFLSIHRDQATGANVRIVRLLAAWIQCDLEIVQHPLGHSLLPLVLVQIARFVGQLYSGGVGGRLDDDAG